mgnify:CR=1 FL=1
MKILSVNAGSSSLKFTLFQMPEGKELIGGYFEKIGLDDSFYSIKLNGEKTKKVASVKDHSEAVKILIDELINNKVISSLNELDGVGHRLVHGGEKYTDSVIITDEVIDTVKELIPLAPLHNPANLTGVKAFMDVLPNTPNVGVFDTAFHQTMKKEQYLYSVPYSWYSDYKVRKYGFHGTSHKYITKTMKEKLGRDDINLIICHIGSGGSLCAVKDGKSFDTTMGFTPNAGIMMGTRSGDIDYSLIPYVMKEAGLSLSEVDNSLNKQSGLLGISGVSSDHRDIESAMDEGNQMAVLSNEMYVDRIVSYIAQYYVALNGEVDALVFTAGLGENAISFRKDVITKLESLGIKLNEEVNNTIAGFKDIHEGVISTSDSKVPVYVLPTNEELMIATDTYQLIK